MIKFRDLCAAYAAQQDQTLAYFQIIRAQAQAFRDGYASAIEAPAAPYESEDGYVDYVRLLSYENGKLVAAHPRLFRDMDENQIVWFGLAITVERNHATMPKRVYAERVGLKWLENAVELHLPDIDAVIVAPRAEQFVDYSDAYRAITKAILSDLSLNRLPSQRT